MGLIQAACGLCTARQIDHVGVSKPVRHLHGPLWCLYVHLTEPVGYTYKFLRPCGQKILGMPIDSPYASGRRRVISYGLPTGYRVYAAFQASLRNGKFEAYSSICRRPLHELYHKLYINEAKILELYSQLTSKLRKKTLPSHWSAVQHDSIKRDMLTIRLGSFKLLFTYMYM